MSKEFNAPTLVLRTVLATLAVIFGLALVVAGAWLFKACFSTDGMIFQAAWGDTQGETVLLLLDLQRTWMQAFNVCIATFIACLLGLLATYTPVSSKAKRAPLTEPFSSALQDAPGNLSTH